MQKFFFNYFPINLLLSNKSDIFSIEIFSDSGKIQKLFEEKIVVSVDPIFPKVHVIIYHVISMQFVHWEVALIKKIVFYFVIYHHINNFIYDVGYK